MSIEVRNISKAYGSQIAVNNVSFQVISGEIVGFIGPNGAGKSTTMKIITGYIPPDSGEVLINGINALEDELSIKSNIGYLPENNPLYNDLYIKEYLTYTAGLYGITGNHARSRVDEVIELTGLYDERTKRIGHLSKGYRQRVGIAQALIHDPDVLILDEPTSGLDPNQIIEIRNLISSAGKEKTILLSTHIMQEVEAICDRVIIINRGEIVADNRAGHIGSTSGDKVQTILVETDREVGEMIWQSISEITHIKAMSDNQYLLETTADNDIRSLIFNLAVNRGFTILSMSLRKKSLEDLFHELTHS